MRSVKRSPAERRDIGATAAIALGAMLVAFGAATLGGCQSSKGGFSLVSAEEYAQLQSAPQARTLGEAEAPVSKAIDLHAPQITVEAPDPRVEIRPPLRLKVRFQAAADASIDVSSFQVIYKYGILRKDITDRIRPYVTLTQAGVSGASSAAIPAGEHTLIIRIRDTMNRIGEQTVTFRVASA